MGIFSSSNPSTPYVPPLGSAVGAPTILGGDTPDQPQGNWRIETRYLPIGPRGHAFLALVGPNGDDKQLHGRSQSINTGEISSMGMDNAKLVSPGDKKLWMTHGTVPIATLASGSHDEMDAIWSRGRRAADAINVTPPDRSPNFPP
jgi:hypothetical protein